MKNYLSLGAVALLASVSSAMAQTTCPLSYCTGPGGAAFAYCPSTLPSSQPKCGTAMAGDIIACYSIGTAPSGWTGDWVTSFCTYTPSTDTCTFGTNGGCAGLTPPNVTATFGDEEECWNWCDKWI